MKSVRAIIVFALVVVVLGALLAPWAFHLVHPHLVGVPFRRVFDRVLLIVATAGLWPLARGLGIGSWTELGFVRSPVGWRHAPIGFLIGFSSFAVSGGLLLGLGLRTWSPAATGAIGALATFVATGLVVAVVEETFFRGGIQGALQCGIGVTGAIIVTSAVYSALHFLKPKGSGISDDAVYWLSGFDYLGQVLGRSWRAPGVGVGFVTLFLAGSILGLAFARTRALYLSMGIHAGWVFTLKTYSWLTDASGPRRWWGGSALVDNVLVWPVLLLVLWLCWKKLKSLPG